MGDAVDELGFVVADPRQLQGGEARQCVVAGGGDQPRPAEALADLVALGLRPLVVPQDRGAEHVACCIEQHQAVHLAGQADGCDLLSTDAGLVQRRSDRLGRRRPPQRR